MKRNSRKPRVARGGYPLKLNRSELKFEVTPDHDDARRITE
jgi:hypothetical protein